ncbi:putative nucleic acid-binding protein [Stackebrandtia albiflava]|uniref:Ribonuclease VapC n=1 Tax=Stackebrandtia albiflava TaxID=406432 RepID=A0A562V343_9ACTN|nr:PIN domain-containing protein [Stackebrandtia albiflava]TWJ12316.1 putative nucleic acid-binding protein [Stackebrandtia albiflava]
MIRYLLDSSALWRILREPTVRKAWEPVVVSAAIGSCHPQRTEFRRSARNRDEFDQMTEMFVRLYPDVPVHESASRWIEATQYRLTAGGAHRGLSVVDLSIAATAAYHGITVLHDDRDFATIAEAVGDLRERRIDRFPQ